MAPSEGDFASIAAGALLVTLPRRPAHPRFSDVTRALEVGDGLSWIGTFGGDRVAPVRGC